MCIYSNETDINFKCLNRLKYFCQQYVIENKHTFNVWINSIS